MPWFNRLCNTIVKPYCLSVGLKIYSLLCATGFSGSCSIKYVYSNMKMSLLQSKEIVDNLLFILNGSDPGVQNVHFN